MKERYWTAPTEAESGRTIMVTGRDCLDKIRESGKFPYLIRVSWKYNSLPNGYPDEIDEALMEQADDALRAAFDADPVAYLAIITTGDGEREWLFYTRSLPIFGKVFNRALADIETTLPVEVSAEEDADWQAYREFYDATYIPDEE